MAMNNRKTWFGTLDPVFQSLEKRRWNFPIIGKFVLAAGLLLAAGPALAAPPVIVPTNGPYAGGNAAIITNNLDGTTITNVTVDGVQAAIQASGDGWARFTVPAATWAGVVAVVAQRDGQPDVNLTYTYNQPGQIVRSTLNPLIWTNMGTGLGEWITVPYALARAEDGLMYCGGTFTNAGTNALVGIASWNGTNWSQVGSGMASNDICSVYALAAGGRRQMYAGGYFTNAGGVGANSIALWTGTAWTNLGAGMDSDVYSLLVSTNGDLYAGGIFNTAGGLASPSVAKWNGFAWTNMAAGPGGRVNALAMAPDGTLYAGGGFSPLFGGAGECVARWDGINWTNVGAGIAFENGTFYVNALACGLDGALYAGGRFTNAAGRKCGNVAKWDGLNWTNLGDGLGNLGHQVYSMSVNDKGDVYVAGKFPDYGGDIAIWDGLNWTNAVSAAYETIYAVETYSTNEVYIGGRLTDVSGIGVLNVAQYAPPITDLPPVTPADGIWTGGTTIAIAGRYLGNGTDITNVTVCGVPAAATVSQSATQVVVRTGAGMPLGAGGVAIHSTSQGSTYRAGLYTVWAPDLGLLGTNLAAVANGEAAALAKGTDFDHIAATGTLEHTFTFTNDSDHELRITGWTTSGVSAANFPIYDMEPPDTIAAHDASQFNIRFTPGGAPGNYTAALNIYNDSTVTPFVINFAGAAWLLSEQSGPFWGGNVIVITNGYFGTITNILVDGQEATLGAHGGNWAVITLPVAASAGTKDIVVETSDNGSATLPGAYTYYLPAAITAVDPSSGVYTGGFAVAIAGSNLCDGTLGDVTNVTLCGVAATVTGVAGDTQVVVTAGAIAIGSAGTGHVLLQSRSHGEISAPNAFTYTAPGLQALGIDGAVIGGGAAASAAAGTDFGYRQVNTNVTRTFSLTNNGLAELAISGWTTNGGGAASFTVSGIPATLAAGGVATFDVSFTPDALGVFTAMLAIANSSTSTPYLVNFKGQGFDRTVEIGPYTGGNTVTFTNGSFGTVTNVLVGGQVATIQDSGDNWVRVTIPAASAEGIKDVVVQTSGGGVSTLYDAYTYRPQAIIRSGGVVPAMGSRLGGYPVILYGTNLCDGTLGDVTEVTLCGVTATVTAVSGTTQIVVTAAAASLSQAGLGNVQSKSTYYGTALRVNGFTYAAPGIQVLGTNLAVIASGSAADYAKGSDFGSRRLGSATVNTFKLTNNGLEGLVISGVVTNGAGAGKFAVSAIPTNLAAGAVATFTVTYTPDALSAFAASLEIANDSGTTPYIVNLAGGAVGVNPASGPYTGGNTVIVTNGSAFGTITNVLVDGVAALLGAHGANWAVITVPACGTGAGAKDIVVQTSDNGNSLLAAVYTYRNPGVIGVLGPAAWTEVAGIPDDYGNRRGIMGVIGSYLYAVPGWGYTNTFRYDGTSWTEVPGLPAPYGYLSGGACGGYLYSVGGSYGGYKTNVFRFNGTAWEEVAGLPAGRYMMGVTEFNGDLYALGGRGSSGYVTNVYRFDGAAWTEVTGLPVANSYLAAATLNGNIYTVGGYNSDDYVTNTYAYNGATWSMVAEAPFDWDTMFAATMNGRIYAGGGNWYTNFYEFDGAAWTEILGAPIELGNAGAMWNGAIYAQAYQATNIYRYASGGLAGGVIPDSGATAGGYTVTIIGSNLCDGTLGDVTNVSLCGIAASLVSVAADTQIVVTAGAAPGAVLGDVRVDAITAGTTVKSNGFNYLEAMLAVLGTNGAVIVNGSAASADAGTDFGFAKVAVPVARTLYLTNEGGAAVTIAGFVTNGANKGNFAIAGIPGSVAAGGVAPFTVTFTPDALGNFAASLEISSNATNTPYVVNLAGKGFGISPVSGPYPGGNTVTITNGNFGDITNVLVGGTSAVIVGSGANWVTITMPALGSAGAQDVVIETSDNGSVLLAGAYTYHPAGRIFGGGGGDPQGVLCRYEFNNTLTDSLGAGAEMVPFNNDTTGYSPEGWYWTASSSPGGGLTGEGPLNTLQGSNYTIRVQVSYAEVSGYRRFLRYQDSDYGPYILDGRITLYGTSGYNAVGPVNQPDEMMDLYITRDQVSKDVYAWQVVSNEVVYCDYGNDGSDYYVTLFSNDRPWWRFFHDDSSIGESTASGTVRRVWLWDQVLTSNQIKGIYGGAETSGVAPASGSHTGGYPVVITGTNLSNGTLGDVTNVTLCGVSATVVSVAGGTQVVVTAGSTSGSVTGAVRVCSADFGVTAKADAFSYIKPTVVTLAGVRMEDVDGHVRICWETGMELETAGFNVYRLEGGAWVKVNATLIPAQGWPNGGVGASYCLDDPGAVAGGAYQYAIEEIERSGDALTYGPFNVRAGDLMIRSAQTRSAGLVLAWPSQDGERYEIYWSPSLRAPFVLLDSAIPARPPLNVFTSGVPARPYGFFHIQARPE